MKISRISKAVGGVSGASIGVAIALLISWSLNEFAGVYVPVEVQNAMAVVFGAALAGVVTYYAPKNTE